MDNELSKGFTGIEINGVRFSNIGEILCYMDRQREQLTKAKEILHKVCYEFGIYNKDLMEEAKQFLNEDSTYERIQKAKYNYTD